MANINVQTQLKTDTGYSKLDFVTDSKQAIRDTNNLPIVGNNGQEVIQYTANMFLPSVGAKFIDLAFTWTKNDNNLLPKLCGDRYKNRLLVWIKPNNSASTIEYSMDGGKHISCTITANSSQNNYLLNVVNGQIYKNYLYTISIYNNNTYVCRWSLPTIYKDDNSTYTSTLTSVNIDSTAGISYDLTIINDYAYIYYGNYFKYVPIANIMTASSWVTATNTTKPFFATLDFINRELMIVYAIGGNQYYVLNNYGNLTTSSSFTTVNVSCRNIETNLVHGIWILQSTALVYISKNNIKQGTITKTIPLPTLYKTGDLWTWIRYINGWLVLVSRYGQINYTSTIPNIHTTNYDWYCTRKAGNVVLDDFTVYSYKRKLMNFNDTYLIIEWPMNENKTQINCVGISFELPVQYQ